MAVRNIIKIDREKCNGCGVCIDSCHEGAIALIDGKATLVSDSYCDGLGACLGTCPMDAITIEQREAEAFDESKAPGLQKNKEEDKKLACGCPGTMVRELQSSVSCCAEDCNDQQFSALTNWPVELMLVPATAPYLKGADILLAADCTGFSLPDFHRRFLTGRKLLIGCPKLDDSQIYLSKMVDILKTAEPRSLTVLRMEVPCCGGLSKIAEMAIELSGVDLPLQTVVVGIDGTIK